MNFMGRCDLLLKPWWEEVPRWGDETVCGALTTESWHINEFMDGLSKVYDGHADDMQHLTYTLGECSCVEAKIEQVEPNASLVKEIEVRRADISKDLEGYRVHVVRIDGIIDVVKAVREPAPHKRSSRYGVTIHSATHRGVDSKTAPLNY